MSRDIANYQRGLLSFTELCLIALAEGYTLRNEDGNITASKANQ